jgi:manganese transport protein
MADSINKSAPIAHSVIRRASLSERTVGAATKVLAGERGGLRAYMAFVGPAVVASIAYMDPGNFATSIQAGAKYGYTLLWVVLLANLIAMLFQALSAKLGIVTGCNLAEMCRDQFPKPVVYAMWVISEIAAMATDLAEFLGGAIGLSLLFSIPLLYGMVVTGVIVYGILMFERFGFPSRKCWTSSRKTTWSWQAAICMSVRPGWCLRRRSDAGSSV